MCLYGNFAILTLWLWAKNTYALSPLLRAHFLLNFLSHSWPDVRTYLLYGPNALLTRSVSAGLVAAFCIHLSHYRIPLTLPNPLIVILDMRNKWSLFWHGFRTFLAFHITHIIICFNTIDLWFHVIKVCYNIVLKLLKLLLHMSHLFFIHLSCLFIYVTLLINDNLEVFYLPLLNSNFQILVHFFIVRLIRASKILLHKLIDHHLIFVIIEYYVNKVFQYSVHFITLLCLVVWVLDYAVLVE